MKTYFRYIEENSNEGETWSAFIKMPATDKEHELFNKLQGILKKIDNIDDMEDSYYIYTYENGNPVSYTEKEVALLLDENSLSNATYMSAYFEGEIKESLLDVDIESSDEFELIEELYKMSHISEI